MQKNSSFLQYTWFVLIMVLLVIIAGSVVRMTQSGMGCPDWPTCFGRWIPPTNAAQLPPDFEKYLRAQDIDHTFNVWHTWIEYINRLLGALLGLFIFIHFIWSFIKFRKTAKVLVYLSLFLLLATGFQGWLGKRVVDANLAVVKITVHMLVALLIAAIPVLIINMLKADDRVSDPRLKKISNWLILAVLVQIVLGTQVREEIDVISKALSYQNREQWISGLGNLFIIHRSFSWIILAGCLFIIWKTYKAEIFRKRAIIILGSVIITVVAGIIMAYLNMPAFAQPLHLVAASILLLSIFNFRLKIL